jgi:hypothetical protein
LRSAITSLSFPTFIVVSESQVMGKLDGADHASPWFKTKNDDVDLSIVG